MTSPYTGASPPSLYEENGPIDRLTKRWLLEGLILWRDGRVKRATKLWRKVLQIDPNNKLAHKYLLSHGGQGVTNDTALSPTRVTLLVRWHGGRNDAHKTRLSNESERRTSSEPGELYEVLLDRATCALQAGDSTLAASLLETCVQRHPNDPTARQLLRIATICSRIREKDVHAA